MLFYKPPKKIQFPIWTIANTEVQRVDSFNFLVITIDLNLTWTEHGQVTIYVIKLVNIINKLKSIIPGNICHT